MSGSVPLLMGDGGPCPGRRWMHFGGLQPTWDPHTQPACHLQEQASYRTSPSTSVPSTLPLPMPSRAGNASDARDILPMAGLVTHSPRAQLQPLAHTDIPYNSSTHPSLSWLCLCSRFPGHMLHMLNPLLNVQNCRYSMNNQLCSAVTGTFLVQAPKVASSADSHQRNFQK